MAIARKATRVLPHLCSLCMLLQEHANVNVLHVFDYDSTSARAGSALAYNKRGCWAGFA